ncbi:MAG: hypothetical protein HC888_00555 [Candidatus Competibacteraceae bacterium]|nr:hypothetical protein [Candidatus Competibacteraceae bacterium]
MNGHPYSGRYLAARHPIDEMQEDNLFFDALGFGKDPALGTQNLKHLDLLFGDRNSIALLNQRVKYLSACRTEKPTD